MGFLEFYLTEDDDDLILEDIKGFEKFKSTVDFRTKKRLSIIKNRLLLKKGLEKSKTHIPSDKVLKSRARKNARRKMSLKIMGKKYDTMSDTEREQFAERLKSQKAIFNKLIQDIFIVLKKEAKEQVRKSLLSKIKKQNKDE